MWERVKVKTAPTELPISLGDLKARIRVDFDDEDHVLGQYLKGAVARIDGPRGIGWAMMEQTWELSLDCFPAIFLLPGAPVTGVVSIKYFDADDAEQTLDSADYQVDVAGDVARIRPLVNWPGTGTRFGAVVVEYTLGADARGGVPPDLIDALCLLVAHRFENRQITVAGGGHYEVPHGFEAIVNEYRRLAAV